MLRRLAILATVIGGGLTGCASYEYEGLRIRTLLRDAEIGAAEASVLKADGTEVRIRLENYSAEHKAVEALATLAGQAVPK